MAQSFYPLWLANPNGGAWPTAFKGNVPATSGAGISYLGPGVRGPNNSREFTKQGVSGESTHLTPLLGINAADVDILYRARLSPIPGSSTFNNTGPVAICARAGFIGSGATGRPGNCYYLTNGQSTTIGAANGQRDLALLRVVAGSQITLDTAADVIATPTDWNLAPYVLMRLQCSGTTIRGRMWMEGDSEPGSWQVSATDSNLAAGDVGVIFQGYGQRVSGSWLSIGTNGDAPLTSAPAYTVAGALRNPSGNLVGAGYVVRCYHQESGAMLGETVTDGSGAWSFTVPTLEPVYVLAVDNLGNTWKAPINDRIVPVVP